MDSMTQLEKDELLLLKHSRIKRIAKGSGCTEKDVKDLIGQWNKSRKMMRGMKGDRKMRRQMQSMMNVDDVDFDSRAPATILCTIGHRAPSSGKLNLNDLSGSGRMDVLVRPVNSALFVSHGIRKDSQILVHLQGRKVQIEESCLMELHFPESDQMKDQ